MKHFVLFLISVFALAVSCEKNVDEKDGQGIVPVESESIQEAARCTFELGIHRTVICNNMSQPSQYEPMFDGIKSTGAKTVRISVEGENENAVLKHILYANKCGLNVTLIVSLASLMPKCYEDGTALSEGNSAYDFWKVYPISRINLERFDDWISTFLMKCKEKGCIIDALEMGNEVMWGAFNADVPITGGIIYDSSYTWDNIPESIREGIRKCGETAVIAQTACRKIFWDNPPKVVFGSLNLGDDTNYYKITGGCIVNPATVIEIASGKYPGMPAGSPDYIRELDGIAVHMYPEFKYSEDYSSMVSASLDYIKWMMDGIARLTDKPVYVTEFGFRYTIYGLGSSDIFRAEMFRAFLEAMDMTQKQYHWRQAHIYSWDQGDYALFVNGAITVAGKTVIKNYYSTD